jgi:hypothetical protein
MEANVTRVAVNAIIEDIVRTLPIDILESYISPPGRRPAPSLLAISSTVREIGDDKTLALIKDVMDATIFSLLALIDAGFKGNEVRVALVPWTGEADSFALRLVEEYRLRVDPGGVVVQE